MKTTVLLLYTSMAALLASAQILHSKPSQPMYIERNVFHLKFGASREALPLWKEYLQRVQQRDSKIHARLLTDVSGPAYTIVVELEYETFGEMEPSQCRLTNQPDWKDFYQKFIPLCEKAERTYYRNQLSF